MGCELGEGYPFKTQEQIDLAKKMRITEVVSLRNFRSALAGCAPWRGFRPCVLAPHDCLGPIAITPAPMLCPASRFSKRSKSRNQIRPRKLQAQRFAAQSSSVVREMRTAYVCRLVHCAKTSLTPSRRLG